MQYNTIPVRTTIEGTIVNEDNVGIVNEWLEEQLDDNFKIQLENILKEKLLIIKCRTTIIRCCLNGKLDTLKNINEEGVELDCETKRIN